MENPYQPPVAEVIDHEPALANHFTLQGQSVSAGASGKWLIDGFRIVKAAPAFWAGSILILALLYAVFFGLVFGSALLHPESLGKVKSSGFTLVLGFVLGSAMTYFFAGMAVGAQSIAETGKASFANLIAPLKTNPVTLGLLILLNTAIYYALVAGLSVSFGLSAGAMLGGSDNGAMAAMGSSGKAVLFLLVFMLLVFVQLTGAFYSYFLLANHKVSITQAFVAGYKGVVKNLLAYLVGLFVLLGLYITFGVITVIVVMLGGLLASLSKILLIIPIAFGVVIGFAILAWEFASFFASYRHIYYQDE